MNHGFREVIVDQPLAAKWTDIDMNLGGGPGTFQGPKYSDTASGFSYAKFPDKAIVQNRFIYWRILNDTLELTESSLNYNLDDNQIRIIFRGSPIIGNISIHETETHVIILVPTLLSVNRFLFEHPLKMFTDNAKLVKNKFASIFRETVVNQVMDFKTFSLFEHTTNILIPVSATSYLTPDQNYIFALSYESGSISICKISTNDIFTTYDLRQANLFSRIFSFTPNILRSTPTAVPDHVIALDFFTTKRKGKRPLHLVTLTQNGRLRLYCCNNTESITDWALSDDIVVHTKFVISSSVTSDFLLLRRGTERERRNEYPRYIVYVAGEGFMFFQVVRPHDSAETNVQLKLIAEKEVEFRENTVTDFCVSPQHLFALISNAEEETKWEVKTYALESPTPTFNITCLDPPPVPDEIFDADFAEPKEYFSDLIFSRNSFSVLTIYSALNMFPNAVNVAKSENDWELTKFYAMRVLESEVRNASINDSGDDDRVMDDDTILELNTKNWLDFYNSCVEYHLTTIKPLGIFYEANSKMPCIVKKSRISFLRPMDFLETLFYLPGALWTNQIQETEDDSTDHYSLLKMFSILDLIETSLMEEWKYKIERYLRENRGPTFVNQAVQHVAAMLLNADSQSDVLAARHFTQVFIAKIQELKGAAETGIRALLRLVSSWEGEEGYLTSLLPENMVVLDRPSVAESFMGSRLGINIGYNISKQLFQHRYMVVRNTLLLIAMGKAILKSDTYQFTIHAHEDYRLQAIYMNLHNLVRLFERSAEFVHENWNENGIKVSNLLRCRQGVPQIHTKLTELWPIKLMELFQAGSGLMIRSRIEQYKHSLPLSFGDALGRTIWPSEGTKEYPLLDFLVSACQFNGLSQYVTKLYDLTQNANPELNVRQKFFNGVADFFIQSPQLGIGRFLSISPQQLVDSPLFCERFLGSNILSPNLSTIFYEKVIGICLIFQYKAGVQVLAQKAIEVTNIESWVRTMSAVGFKSALSSQDYESALFFIGKMCCRNGTDLIERDSSVRTLVTDILEKRDIDILLSLPFHYYGETEDDYREQVEKVLASQAKLSDPLLEDGIYQMVYFYHICRRDFYQAGYSLLERIVQIGVKGSGKSSLELQRDTYLDALTCISLARESEERKTNANLKGKIPPDYGGSGDTALQWKNILMNNEKDEEKILPSIFSDESRDSLLLQKLGSYETVKMEAELCSALLLLNNERDVEPIKLNDEKRRAEKCVESLVQLHRFDQALNICSLWNLPFEPVIHEITKTCVKVTYEVKPPSGDSADYAKYIDTSELGSGKLAVEDIVFLALKKYVSKYEKSSESTLHQTATMVFLGHKINLPRWLYDSYKKRNASQLLWCFMKYGDWEDATTLAISIFDAALGIRNSEEFDPSIQKVSELEPLPNIPFTALDELANELNARIEDGEHKLEPLLYKLRVKAEDYVIRVIDTREHRQMFAY